MTASSPLSGRLNGHFSCYHARRERTGMRSKHSAPDQEAGPPDSDPARLVELLRVLAAASRSMAGADDEDTLLGGVGSAIVPALADAAVLYGRAPNGSLEGRSLPPESGTGQALAALCQESSDAASGLLAQLEGGSPRVLSAGCPRGDRAQSAYREPLLALGVTTALLTPIVQRGERIGLLLLARTATAARYSEVDVLLVEMLAAQLGAALAAQQHAARATTAIQRLEETVRTGRDLAHTLNNDLTMPIGTLELLLDRGAFSADAAEMLKAASQDLAALETHVRQFHDQLRAMVGEPPVSPPGLERLR